MHGFELDQLRSLISAVEAGSLTAAAPLRNLSQSAVSEQLRKLEEQAGCSLLVRSKAGVKPTDHGLRLVEHAKKILALSDTAWRDLHDVALAGELRLAITDYFRPSGVAALLARFAARHPGIRLQVRIDKSDAIEEGHARGEFDLAITMRAAGTPVIKGATAIGSETLVWAGIAGTLLQNNRAVPLVALPETCSLRRLAVSLLEKQRMPYYVAHVATGVAGLRSAVAAGLGIACLNTSALEAPVVALRPGRLLPALPRVAFRVLPARAGENALAASVRALAIESLSAPAG